MLPIVMREVIASVRPSIGEHLAVKLQEDLLNWREHRGVELGSPLEEKFLAYWGAFRYEHAEDYSCELQLIPQHKVQVENKAYRLDFIVCWDAYGPTGDALLEADFARWKTNGGRVSISLGIAVELDGYDFHERTPEQVAHRDQRDRLLQGAGWRIAHFSGSEFNRDPMACIREVYEVGVKAAESLLEQVTGKASA